ncbi:MAG: hypothetical protein JWO94_2079 [Verrucomicrobiaceae bacterium]|nr:hypothetical protein [Verrucomicrobiaceae bacterium]
MAPTPDQRLALRQRPDRIPAMRQRWSRLLFAHWKIDPVLIQKTLPAGLHVDTINGEAWVGIVPFYMQRIRPVFAPALPWLSWFLELNVRTYVHDDHGNSGVWFYSLDCNQPVAVEIARRAFHLPYQHARMKAVLTGETVDYHCQRKGQPITSRYQYKPAGALRVAEPDSLEFFLLERYLLFSTSSAGLIYTGQVHHQPYVFTEAACDTFDLEPIRQAGFEAGDSPAQSLLYSPGVDVTVFPLRLSTTA